ncbi:unnamed protein product [Phytophthora lilii]|uniref:Unnamed protein product n=1 Tax=Phytophthora lilii TaxID=2077276 RepID=A0A9W6WTL3_9STRA|nr:unnamed protein product [Phytophthora lilii]
MKLRSMNFEQALAFVVERRPIANPNESFRRQLQEYGRRLQRAVVKQKSARAARGPVGPSLPPSVAKSETNDAVKDQDPATSIGPQLPPHLMKGRAAPASSSEKLAEDKKSEVEEKAVIGPSIPPHLKRQRDGNDDGEDTSSKKRKSEHDE